MDTYGTRTCRGLQPDDARVGANGRDAAEIGASLGRLLNHKDLPTSHGIREVDRLDTPTGVMEEEAHLLKSIFESVTELGVAHGVAS